MSPPRRSNAYATGMSPSPDAHSVRDRTREGQYAKRCGGEEGRGHSSIPKARDKNPKMQPCLSRRRSPESRSPRSLFLGNSTLRAKTAKTRSHPPSLNSDKPTHPRAAASGPTSHSFATTSASRSQKHMPSRVPPFPFVPRTQKNPNRGRGWRKAKSKADKKKRVGVRRRRTRGALCQRNNGLYRFDELRA
jgi:hypothetical protein